MARGRVLLFTSPSPAASLHSGAPPPLLSSPPEPSWPRPPQVRPPPSSAPAARHRFTPPRVWTGAASPPKTVGSLALAGDHRSYRSRRRHRAPPRPLSPELPLSPCSPRRPQLSRWTRRPFPHPPASAPSEETRRSRPAIAGVEPPLLLLCSSRGQGEEVGDEARQAPPSPRWISEGAGGPAQRSSSSSGPVEQQCFRPVQPSATVAFSFIRRKNCPGA